jgi:acetylglutamate kinase
MLVVKYGGSAMTEPHLRRKVAKEIAHLRNGGRQPIIVHGGGPFIKAALEGAGLESSFVRGLRVTTPESLEVIESVLTRLSKVLAQEIGDAVGLSGRDARLLVGKVKSPELGLVGEVRSVNVSLLEALLHLELIPVVACLAGTPEGEGVLNVNADSVAGAVAGALGAPVIFLSDVPGVLDDPRDADTLIAALSEDEVGARIEDGRISGGMIPKVEAALEALRHGASFAVIADGRDPKTLEAAALGRAGTRLYRRGEA